MNQIQNIDYIDWSVIPNGELWPDVLRDFSYKPEWQMWLTQFGGPYRRVGTSPIALNARIPAIDTYTGKSDYLTSNRGFIGISHRLEGVQWLEEFIVSIELHEMYEWFKMKGKVINDPHDPQCLQAWQTRGMFM